MLVAEGWSSFGGVMAAIVERMEQWCGGGEGGGSRGRVEAGRAEEEAAEIAVVVR